MKSILIILILALIISIMVNILTMSEANNISQSLDFLSKNKTQMRIQTSFRLRAFNKLSQNINDFLDRFHAKEKTYILNEKNLQSTITGLSHDIRTPLTSLGGYLQLLAKSEDPSERDKYLSIMQGRIKSLNKILDQLFTFAKLQEDDYKLELEDVNIKKIALETLLNYYEDFIFRDIEPQINFVENDIFLSSNKDALERIFQNIYKNILEHGTNPLSLSLRDEDKEIIFESSNAIKGQAQISEEDIFKEFYKADTSRNSSSTGLGLSITKGLVEKLGGKITAQVDNGKFIIRITFSK